MSMRKAVLRVTLILALVVIGGFSRTARAEDIEAAKAAYKAGAKHFNLGEYQPALERFKEAYRQHEDPLFLFNIAQCQRLLGHPSEAILSFRAYLRESHHAPNRADVEKLIEKLQQEVSTQEDEKKQPPQSMTPEEQAQQAQQQQQPQPPPAAQLQPTPPPPGPSTEVVVVAPVPERVPVYKKWWLWTAVGVGVLAIGLGVGLGVGLSKPAFPSTSTTDGTFHF